MIGRLASPMLSGVSYPLKRVESRKLLGARVVLHSLSLAVSRVDLQPFALAFEVSCCTLQRAALSCWVFVCRLSLAALDR